jgi:hypothetical protein
MFRCMLYLVMLLDDSGNSPSFANQCILEDMLVMFTLTEGNGAMDCCQICADKSICIAEVQAPSLKLLLA